MNLILNSIAFLGTQELLIVGVIILVLFGGAKIPTLMRGLGRGMGEFQKGINEGKKGFEDMAKEAEDKDA
ncbi:MAG: twin-arginine translocase TatA/TatE family subunit [Fimbriimonadaceae bacterium]|nr:twin-arginine translocase TatA/TatE family subunit [Fimbriimonadaceae bacterium]QYK53696.1 MAG: twin-arginine translocase TatA/TatE family subunit [Fimbriimonadaceae bacterium]